MTGIVGITALQELRKFKGFENAIIAGGFVRDSLMGGTFKDLDIFVPVTSDQDFKQKIMQHWTEITPTDAIDVYYPEDKINQFIDQWKKDHPKKSIFEHLSFDLNSRDNIYHIHERKRTKEFDKKIGNFTNFTRVETRGGVNYRDLAPSFIEHYDCKYMDFLDVDICAYRYDPESKFDGSIDGSDFASKVVSEFNYNIDKVYYDGEITVQTDEFQSDFRNSTATLTRLKDMYSLPYAMKKYERLHEKYPQLKFDTTVLTIKEEDTSHKENKYAKTKGKYSPYTNFINVRPRGDFINNIEWEADTGPAPR